MPAPVGGLYRAGRYDDVYRFPTAVPWDEASGDSAAYGQRWEDPRNHVPTIYCASTRAAAIGASIWMYRARVLPGGRSVVNDVARECGAADEDEPRLRSAEIPPSYFDDAVTARLEVAPGARFVDLAHPDTHACLTDVLGTRETLGSGTRFTRSTLFCGPNRRIPRAAARYYHELSQTGDDERIVGLRFEICADPDWEFWALWEGAPLAGAHPWWVRNLDIPTAVAPDDHDLLAAVANLQITIP